MLSFPLSMSHCRLLEFLCGPDVGQYAGFDLHSFLPNPPVTCLCIYKALYCPCCRFARYRRLVVVRLSMQPRGALPVHQFTSHATNNVRTVVE